jgi:membrane protease YdiL (CAAX protease family)
MVILPNYEHKIWDKVLFWIPEWYRLDMVNYKTLPMQGITIILMIVVNGIAAPVMEEIYFRGFLLPRMRQYGKFAPLINVVLFSVYHFHALNESFTRIFGMTPYVYSVWKTKNIRIGIIVHVLMNIFGIISTIAYIAG